VTDVTEVRKEWSEDPIKENGFVDLFKYSGKEDTLKPSDTLVNGESEILNRIASYVREWSGNWDAVWSNIQLRAKMKEMIVKLSDQLKRPEILEAEWTIASNNIYHLLAEKAKKETGYADPKKIYNDWLAWFKEEVKKKV
jgi:hypothetical protein